MEIDRINENWNKVNTKGELIELLNNYKKVLNKSTIDYLNSLINLDFSVIRNYISDEEREVLSELEVYKRIAIFNIYTRALNIFKQNESEIKIEGNNCGREGLYIYDRGCKLFEFDYIENYVEGYKQMKIGDISLFKTIENKEIREAEMNRVLNNLDKLYDEKNPYGCSSRTHVPSSGSKRNHIPRRINKIGGQSTQWEWAHDAKIKDYEEKVNMLDKKELTSDDKKEIEKTNYFNKLLLDDYGLTNSDFKEEKDLFAEELTSKTLVKKLPGISINNNIKYI